MPSLVDYVDREQAYIKHVFLKHYLEALFHKTGSTFNQIVYVDGFAGPWLSAAENFEDTSFGVALNALRGAQASLAQRGRNVTLTALLVEQNQTAFARLETVREKFPEITIKTYNADFRTIIPELMQAIPTAAFAFFLIDPKGWRIPLEQLRPLLSRLRSEVVFNFMFEFINRAASMTDPVVINGLNDLMPLSGWQQRMRDAEEHLGFRFALTSEQRKDTLVGAFSDDLKKVGGYEYVAEITILRPLQDRPLYCLVYGSRHETGIEVFRDSQMMALKTQAQLRAQGQIKATAAKSGQSELFESTLDMGPDKTKAMLDAAKKNAAAMIVEIVPRAPDHILYRRLWATVLARHSVRRRDVNTMCADLKKAGALLFPDWEPTKRVPQDSYRVQRP